VVEILGTVLGTSGQLENCPHSRFMGRTDEMSIFPMLRLALPNQWVLLLIYAGALTLMVSRLSANKRKWLFEDPKQALREVKKLLLRFDQLLAMVIVAGISLTPILGPSAWLSAIGLAIYVAGTVVVMVAVHYFGLSPGTQPVVQGPYRFSRNPQWVGLFLVFLGLAVAGGSIVVPMLVIIFGLIYHIQILEVEKACKAKFGPTFEQYMRQVPRYFLKM
jgi:protein-S-isoprenylcysteine O-methyltransferase Ste14